jgi:hypothetical protein
VDDIHQQQLHFNPERRYLSKKDEYYPWWLILIAEKISLILLDDIRLERTICFFQNSRNSQNFKSCDGFFTLFSSFLSSFLFKMF